MLWLNHLRFSGRKFGSYTIEKVAGEGRYGICLNAYSNRGARVIIKWFKSSSIKRDKKRTAVEADILSKIDHFSIPKLLGVINEKGGYGLILEEKPGDTVESMLFKHRHQFSRKEIFRIVSQLVDIIWYLHDKGIIHGDIRPPNVIINNGAVYLIDFGLSRRVDYDKNTFDIDFSYLGEFLLYLLYSSFKSKKYKKFAWYNELYLLPKQKILLKRLLRLEKPYENIREVADDFHQAFGCEEEINYIENS
ncbi:MAG: protein kinase family protein [Oscillospiraceae bacterium]|nr:protein kinase family protein [Oscillospiraceae bacterium]MDD4510085.1 protein kinase family protein [Oscillospiraceae bacterium]